MYHQDARLRRQAAEMLLNEGNFERNVLEALVHGVLDPDSGVKDICYRALSKAHSKDAKKAAMFIAPFIAHKDIEIRNLTGDILNKIGEPALDPLMPFIDEDDPYIRQFAVDIIGNIGNETAEDSLSKLLNDPDLNVRASTIEAIGNLKLHNMIDRIIDLFNTEEDLNPTIIETLGKIGGEKAEQFISYIFKNEEDYFLKTTAIDALSLCGSSYAICKELVEQLESTPEELQTTLLKTIFGIAYRNDLNVRLPDGFRYIAQKALLDDDTDIRGAGLVALSLPYIESDIPGLINEVIQYNPETQQIIIYNLLVKSPSSIIRPFFNRFTSVLVPDGTFLEFCSFMTPFWNDIPKDNIEELIDMVFEDYYLTSISHLDEFIQILLHINNDKVIHKLKKNLLSDDLRIIAETIDVILKLNISNLSEELLEIKKRGLLSDKIDNVLEELS